MVRARASPAQLETARSAYDEYSAVQISKIDIKPYERRALLTCTSTRNGCSGAPLTQPSSVNVPVRTGYLVTLLTLLNVFWTPSFLMPRKCSLFTTREELEKCVICSPQFRIWNRLRARIPDMMSCLSTQPSSGSKVGNT